jgi:hypothetical protein
MNTPETRTMPRISTLILALTSLGLPACVAGAADLQDAKNLLCVPTDLVECSGAGHCERVTAEELGLPRFLNVDLEDKQLRGEVDGAENTTTIHSVQKVEGKTVLQGAENGRAWSLVISHDTGAMSGAIAGDKAGFVVLGACMVR